MTPEEMIIKNRIMNQTQNIGIGDGEEVTFDLPVDCNGPEAKIYLGSEEQTEGFAIDSGQVTFDTAPDLNTPISSDYGTIDMVDAVTVEEDITEPVGAAKDLKRESVREYSSVAIGYKYLVTQIYRNGPDSKAWAARLGVNEAVWVLEA